ncbi:hypothetical protein LGH83_10160 [Lichenihabitans sp. PAMC28606]|uniref:hypothetical protein n=1 Tax=Lichenihabitans sp. PAMC28606 TaxID=2880932 RepID=UPI001D0BD8DD|nr:hypothetical protein [Lichenihabitans sp. PAMC28606]UDL96807.1 hypothetical protein LGH83_10160 [Lichenihabitans sp. PAMC28606]
MAFAFKHEDCVARAIRGVGWLVNKVQQQNIFTGSGIAKLDPVRHSGRFGRAKTDDALPREIDLAKAEKRLEEVRRQTGYSE